MSTVSAVFLLVAMYGLIAAGCCAAMMTAGNAWRVELERLGIGGVALALAAGAAAALAGGL